MSTNLALVDPVVSPRAPQPRRGRPRPELVEVTPTRAQRRARPRVAYAITGVVALGVLLLAQLGISMVLSQGAYRLDSLTTQQTDLTRSQQSLDEQLQVLESPQNLSRNAQALGMIANTTPVYLDPKTGRVYGTPTPAAPDANAAADANQVPNALLGGVPLAAKQGDTATSKQNGADEAKAVTGTGAAGDAASGDAASGGTDAASGGTDAAKSSGASASNGGSADSSVGSDPNQLQAPSTR